MTTNLDQQVSDVAFLQQFADLLAQIDAMQNGPSDLVSFLQTNVYGQAASRAKQASVSSSDTSSLLKRIFDSKTFQQIETFFTTVLQGLLPESVSIPLAVADPKAFVAWSQATVRCHIDRELVNGRLTADEYSTLVAGVGSNPFKAEQDLRTLLHTKYGDPIPPELVRVPPAIVALPSPSPSPTPSPTPSPSPSPTPSSGVTITFSSATMTNFGPDQFNFNNIFEIFVTGSVTGAPAGSTLRIFGPPFTNPSPLTISGTSFNYDTGQFVVTQGNRGGSNPLTYTVVAEVSDATGVIASDSVDVTASNP